MSEAQVRETLPQEVAALVASSARLADLCKVTARLLVADNSNRNNSGFMSYNSRATSVRQAEVMISKRVTLLIQGDVSFEITDLW